MIMAFVDSMRAEGHAVEPVCQVLREQGCQVAARTYRAWKQAGRPVAARTVSDAHVVDAIREVCWTAGPDGRRRLTPEGLYGRRKLTAYLRRTGLPVVAECTVARAMRTLGHQGISRAKGIRTTIPAKDGVRAGDLLDRNFHADAPDAVWVTDFTYVRTWAGWVYVAFILDCFAQRIVAWHASTSKETELVMVPLRMALWQRGRDGHPVGPQQLIHHSDAGSQGGLNRSSQHLTIVEVCGGTTSAAGGPGSASGDAFARAADPGAARGACVLAADRAGQAHRGGGAAAGRVDAGRGALVSSRWRDGAAESCRAVRALPVVRRA